MNKYSSLYFGSLSKKLAYSAAPNGVEQIPNGKLLMPSKKRMIQEGEMDLANYGDDAVSGPSAVRASAALNKPSISIRGDETYKMVDRRPTSPLKEVSLREATKPLISPKVSPGVPPSRRGNYMGSPVANSSDARALLNGAKIQPSSELKSILNRFRK
jgi:hypothetical protein